MSEMLIRNVSSTLSAKDNISLAKLPSEIIAVANSTHHEPVSSHKKVRSSSLKQLLRKTISPQVWARIRPSPKFQDNVIQVDETGKYLGIRLDDQNNKPGDVQYFPTDGILYNSSQEDTYILVAHDLIQKAFNGVSSLFVALGAEDSGKNFTLFGTPGKYHHRGLIPRTIDEIFNTVEKIQEEKFCKVFISSVQIFQNHIRDLITLTPYNIDCIGLDGPCQKLMHEVYNRDEAGAILHRIFAEKRKFKKASPEKFHTFIYFDICIVNIHEKSPVQKSRITFAKIASIPTSKNLVRSYRKQMAADEEYVDAQGCPFPKSDSSKQENVETRALPFIVGAKCCVRKGNSSEDAPATTEIVDLRRDLFFLEQLFARSNLLRKLNIMQLKRPELLPIHFKTVAPSQYFRQCKLTHCLKDIGDGNTEIRIITHVRPEATHIDATMNTLKFVKQAKSIPQKIKRHDKHRTKSSHNSKSHKVEESILNTLLYKESSPDKTIELNPYQVKIIGQQINQYFQGKLDQAKVTEQPMKPNSKTNRDRKETSKIAVEETENKEVEKDAHLNPVNDKHEENEIESAPISLGAVASATQFITRSTSGLRKKNKMDKSKQEIKDKDVSSGKNEKNNGVSESVVVDDGKSKKELEEHSKTQERSQIAKDKKTRKRSDESKKESKVDSKKTTDKITRRKSHSPANKKAHTKPATHKSHYHGPKDNSPAANKPTHEEKEESSIPSESEMFEEETEPLTVKSVWNSFIKNPEGRKMCLHVKRHLDSNGKISHEKTYLTKYAANLLNKIQSTQRQLDNINQTSPEMQTAKNKASNAEKKLLFEIKMMQLARDPMLVRLCNMKSQFKTHNHDLEDARKSCEDAFQTYAKQKFDMDIPAAEIPINTPGFNLESSPSNLRKMQGKSESLTDLRNKTPLQSSRSKNTTTGTTGGLQDHQRFIPRRRIKSMPEISSNSMRSKHYKHISSIGQMQARFLRKINHYRPPWVKYY